MVKRKKHARKVKRSKQWTRYGKTKSRAPTTLRSMMSELLESFERERREWGEERERLIARLEWHITPTGQEVGKLPPATPTSQPDESRPEPEELGYTAAQLAKMGLVANSEGGFVHIGTKILYDRVEDFEAWQAFLNEHGLHKNTKPGDVDQNLLVGGP